MKNKNTVLAASPDALKSQAAAVRLLDEHYDKTTGRYADGWSDAAVSKECGLAETAVATFRDAVYGPLAVDPAVSEIKWELDAFADRWAKERDDLEHLLKSARDDYGKQLADLQVRLLDATNGRKAPNGAA